MENKKEGNESKKKLGDILLQYNTKSNHIMVSFTHHYKAISIDRLPGKTKIGEGSWGFKIIFYVSLSSTPLQSRFKDNAKILSKNSTTQENITISRQNLLFY